MTASWSQEDKFNPDKGFSRVHFGYDTPLLGIELNELQKIFQYQLESLVRGVYSNGFLNKSSMTLSTGTLTLQPDTVFINGKVIKILEPMTISVSNNDIIYLEIGESVVNYTMSVKKGGNLSGGTPLDNSDIYDSEVGEETARRVQQQIKLTKTNTDNTKTYYRIASISSGGALVDERVKLSSITEITPAMVRQDSSNRFMTDAERTKLSGISTNAKKVESSSTNGNIKIDGVETNVYTHPATHSLDMIVETSTKKIMTDAERTKLAGIATGAQVNEVNSVNSKTGHVVLTPSDVGALPISGGTLTGKLDIQNGIHPIQSGRNGADALSTYYYGLTIMPLASETGFPAGYGTAVTWRYNESRNFQLFHVKNENRLMLRTWHDANSAWTTWDELETVAGANAKVSAHEAKQGSAHQLATSSVHGFMSSSDKSKLDGIASGAQVNQNAFSNVKVGASTVSADSPTDTLELIAGSGITLTPNTGSDTVTIALTNPNTFSHVKVGGTTISADNTDDTVEFIAGTGITLTPDSTNDRVTFAVSMDDSLHGNRGGGSLHAVATPSTHGFMSSSDKDKLDRSLSETSFTLPATAGWYRIAQSTSGIARNVGRFEIDWYHSGNHGAVVLEAGSMYGSDGSTEINQIKYINYLGEGVNGLTKARIVYHNAYNGNYAYLEVYNSTATAITVNVDLVRTLGWSLISNPPQSDTVPSGYKTKELTFSNGLATTGILKSTVPTGKAPLSVDSTTVVPNFNADMLDGFHASSFVQTSRNVNTGTGLTGGGNLSSDRTISFDTSWGDGRYLRKDTNNTYDYDFTFKVQGTSQPIALSLDGVTGTWARGISALLSSSRVGGFGLYGSGTSVTSFRVKTSGDWWTSPNFEVDASGAKINGNTVWHSGNDGSGSGMDADTVDGVHVSSLVQTSRTIVAGTGLTGGGDLSSNRTINLDTSYTDARYLNATGGTLTGDVTISKNNAWLTLDSPSTGADTNEQAAGISIGESGYKGSAALHITYTGDGYGYIGMGTVTNSIPQYEVLKMHYQSNTAMFKGKVTIEDGSIELKNGGSTELRVQNSLGYIDLGPKNSSYCHIYTDMPEFYFNKEIKINGQNVVKADRNVYTGTGLTGGGSLASNRTLSLDTAYTDGRYLRLTGGTMTGHITMDTSSEKHIKSSSLNAGLYFNSTNLGVYDWTNNRLVWRYNPTVNDLQTSLTWTLANGTVGLVNPDATFAHIKQSGYKSWAIHHGTGSDNLYIEPSASVNGTDFAWNKGLMLKGTGEVVAQSGLTSSGALLLDSETFDNHLNIKRNSSGTDYGARITPSTNGEFRFIPYAGTTEFKFDTTIKTESNMYFLSGNYKPALDLSNSDLIGLNALIFRDNTGDSTKEGIFFPKSGVADYSTNVSDYDRLYTDTSNILHYSGSMDIDGSSLRVGSAVRFTNSGGVSYFQAGTDANDVGAELRIVRSYTSADPINIVRVYCGSTYIHGSLHVAEGGVGDLYLNGRTILMTDPGNYDQIWFNDTTNEYWFLADASSSKATSGAGTLRAAAFTVVSDRKKKENIEPVKLSALDIVNNAKVYNYRYKHDITTEKKGRKVVEQRMGLMADELPNEMTTVDNGGVDLYSITSVLWKSVQELSDKNKKLKAEKDKKIKSLEDKVSYLESKLEEVLKLIA